MARGRASDYDDKRRAILDRSARLFATHGYDRASIAMIAAACGVSKALLYHYYKDKDELLFDIIRAHLDELIAAVEPAAAIAEPRKRLVALATALLDAYRDADAEHQVQINHLRLLPPDKQEILKDLERQLVAFFADAIVAAVPAVAANRALLKPLTMSLFGMLNWKYLWFRPGGPLTSEDYARLAVHLVVEGAADLPADLARVDARRQAAE
jgi:TetR/AcrR family transcriptional regulator